LSARARRAFWYGAAARSVASIASLTTLPFGSCGLM
jgi:hypothetical protein